VTAADRKLYVFTNGVDHVVAYDAGDAVIALAVEHWGDIDGAEYDGGEFTPCDDNALLTINDDDNDEGERTKTMREWADTEGRGFLCSTEY